jgi:hypothetical protein
MPTIGPSISLTWVESGPWQGASEQTFRLEKSYQCHSPLGATYASPIVLYLVDASLAASILAIRRAMSPCSLVFLASRSAE